MKRAFSSHNEVAHVWAQQKQSEGHASHMFFEGPSIFSYGHHFEIARFVTPNIVLFNCERYSVSTGKHQSRAYSAVSHKTVFTVPSMNDHTANALYLVGGVVSEIDRLKRARKGIRYHVDIIEEKIREAHSYLAAFRRKIKAEVRKSIRGLDDYRAKQLPKTFLDAKLEKERNAEKLLEIKREEQRRVAALAEAERLEKWKAGEDVGYLWASDVALRIKEDRIETTKGANIPLIEARKFWKALQDRKDVVGMRLGYYTVDSLDGKTLRVGCHNIPVREVVRMAKSLKWDDGKTLEVIQ